jgi:arylsulfatase A-like enzyme
MTSNIDHNVGRILDHLDRLSLSDETLVIFFSDHGDMLGEHGYYCGYKPQGYRAAMHVPFIARYPNGFDGGKRTEAMIDVAVDTPVTLLDLVGASPLTEADGMSYKAVLNGGQQHRDKIHYQTFRMNDGAWGEFTPVPERGIRTEEWVYIRQPNRRKFLFDQKADPHELNNLAQSIEPGHTAVMDNFDKQIERHMAATGDDWEVAANFPPPDFLTHEAAKDYLDKVLLPNAIEVSA